MSKKQHASWFSRINRRQFLLIAVLGTLLIGTGLFVTRAKTTVDKTFSDTVNGVGAPQQTTKRDSNSAKPETTTPATATNQNPTNTSGASSEQQTAQGQTPQGYPTAADVVMQRCGAFANDTNKYKQCMDAAAPELGQ